MQSPSNCKTIQCGIWERVVCISSTGLAGVDGLNKSILVLQPRESDARPVLLGSTRGTIGPSISDTGEIDRKHQAECAAGENSTADLPLCFLRTCVYRALVELDARSGTTDTQ